MDCSGRRHHRFGRVVEFEAGGDSHHPDLNCQQVSGDIDGEDNFANIENDQNRNASDLGQHCWMFSIQQV